MVIVNICGTVVIITYLFSVFVPSTSGLSKIAAQKLIDECFERATKDDKSQNLTSRFPEPMIRGHCQKSVQWRKDFLDSLSRSGAQTSKKPKPMTKAQKDWITQIWKCQDKYCMCMMFDSCKKLLDEEFEVEEDDSSNSTIVHFAEQFQNSTNNARTRRQIHWQTMNEILNSKVRKVTRKEIRQLSDQERQKLFDAFNRLKTETIDDRSKYDILILYHTPEYAPQAHFCAAFLPYHRELLKGFEMALRTIDPDVALPYWDTTLDYPLPDQRDSIMWTPLFFGEGFGDVRSGAFANWTAMRDTRLGPLSKNNVIYRNLGTAPYSVLVKQQDLDRIMERNFYMRDFTYCVNQFFELAHGGVHLWVGGHMLELRLAPNDPVFFFYHAFLDLLWEHFRQTRQNRWQRENDYPTGRETCGAICQSDQQMRPFPMRIIDALSNAYTDYLYDYGKRPTCTYAYPHCGSKYLFCDRTKNRCLSKIKMNGNCQGFEGYDCCYDGRCINGRCYPNPPTTTTTTTTQITTPLPKPSRFSFPGDSTSNTVWFPITILSLTFDGTIREYKDARVVTKDLETGQVLKGTLAENPRYTGNAYAQIYNPYRSGSPREQVRAAVEVTGRSTKCSGYCLMHGRLLYAPCEPAIIKLGKNTEKRDMLLATSHQTVTDMQWQDQKRVPDKFLFLCSSGASEERHSVASIAVQDLDEKKFSERSCIDNHRCCKVWQLPVADRCQSVAWLKKSCPRSCHVCGDGILDKESDECSDFNSECPKWAAEKQCQLNGHWMEENCRRSCNVCQRSNDQLRHLCKDDSSVKKIKEAKKECKDLHVHCPAWSKTGECQKNSQWMAQNCPKSCKMCA